MKKNIFKIFACIFVLTLTLASTGSVAFAAEIDGDSGGETTGSASGSFTLDLSSIIAKYTEEAAVEENTAEETAVEETTEVQTPVVEETTVVQTPVVEETTAAQTPVVEEETTVVQTPVVEETTAVQTPVVTEETTVAQTPVVKETTAVQTPVAEETVTKVDSAVGAVASSTAKVVPKTSSVQTFALTDTGTSATKSTSNNSFTLDLSNIIKSFTYKLDLKTQIALALAKANNNTTVEEEQAPAAQPDPVVTTPRIRYSCNCGYSTDDYSLLKKHMAAHALKRERYSYTEIIIRNP
ncbi:MAG: hypothetical protein NC121_06350 [Blautia sp.]|nr:hypothetical protein [Blautia sp.]